MSETDVEIPPSAIASLDTFEARLNSNLRWAMSEGSLFFEGKGAVQESLHRIARRLRELNIPYAVCGGMALYAHGYRRFTEDVDLLVTSENLKRIHEELEGLGYVEPFPRSKHLRDARTKVKIEFLIAGQFPGDGKPKEVAFPDPASASVEIDGVHYLNLPTLVNMKLASGMSNAQRGKDLTDVAELIRTIALPRGFESKLAPSVRQKFLELWDNTNPPTQRFIKVWRNKYLTLDAKSLDDVIESLSAAASELQRMKADGVLLDIDSGVSDDYAYLVTSDPLIAKKYGMEPESDLMLDE